MDEDPSDKKPPSKVGYKNPPEHSRFKPGQSGNPKGKRKGQQGYKSIARAVLNEKVSVRTARGERRMTKYEALIHTSLNNALKGDPKATDQVLKIAREVGLADDIADTMDAPRMESRADEDRAILKRYGIDSDIIPPDSDE